MGKRRQHAYRVGQRRHKLDAGAGVTLLEILIGLMVSAALAAIAIPVYTHYVNDARVGRAKVEIAELSEQIEQYHSEYHAYPTSLSKLNVAIPNDPWGHTYHYLAIDTTPPPNPGKVLKDKSLHPLNSDFDLYSLGANDRTTTEIAAQASQDDIVRAANGSFIGLASDY